MALDRQIGTKRFGMEDQRVFASLSLDQNPMHVDDVAARRLMTGRPVVHGMHVLVTCLELWDNPHGQAPLKLDCTFNSAISVEDVVVFTDRSVGADQLVIHASVEGVVCTKLRMSLGPAAPRRVDCTTIQPASDASDLDIRLGALQHPLDEPPTRHLHQRYRIGVRPLDPAQHFPRACQNFGALRTSALLTLSYFVGMVCPGQHSIFSSVNLDFRDDPQATEAAVVFSVAQYDERFHLYNVALRGALTGRLAAFMRPPPLRQPAIAEIATQVGSGEFKGTQSLVIGASRGLGELVAKILASGGGDVVLSYAKGLEDVQKLHDEIQASGHGTSRIQQLDVTSANLGPIDFQSFDAIYFFATPRIGRKKSAVFVPSLLAEFIDFYAKSLHDLCVHIERLDLKKKIRIYVPSSTFITERPDGMTEYAMAKAATEVLAADINRTFKKVSIMATRLPKLSTDQTSSVLNERTGDNLSALLPVVRAMVA